MSSAVLTPKRLMVHKLRALTSLEQKLFEKNVHVYFKNLCKERVRITSAHYSLSDVARRLGRLKIFYTRMTTIYITITIINIELHPWAYLRERGLYETFSSSRFLIWFVQT